jgi:lipopolysaccharide export system protein LptC
VIRRATPVLLLLLAAALPALADVTSRISAKRPIINFSLPTFTNPDGYRSWLIRGSEAMMTEKNIIDVKELSLTVFSEDASNQINTIMLSPAARILPEEKIVTGDSTLRVIDLQKDFEATGTGWHYTHKDKTVILNKNVRVVLRAPITDILK